MRALLSVEFRRMLGRDLVLVLAAIALGGIVVAGASVAVDSKREAGPGAAQARRLLEEERARCEEDVAEHPSGFPPGVSPEEFCIENVRLESFHPDERFHLTSLRDVFLGTSFILALGGLLLGGSFIGAEWHAGTLTTLLTWEARRPRVFLAKLVAATAVIFALAVLLQALLGLVLAAVAALRGTTEGADAAWLDSVVGVALRSATLAAVAGAIAYAVATVGRNTAAALGVPFAYLAVVERIIGGLRPRRSSSSTRPPYSSSRSWSSASATSPECRGPLAPSWVLAGERPYTGPTVHRYAVDLRSDTVTTPSPAMRKAMAEAEVGDDWYGDDPTVNRLQERAAEVTGKEAALYVATGTMANQIGLRLHFHGTGHLVVAEVNAHVATTEVMSSAVLSGIAYRTMRGDARGQVMVEQVAEALEPDEYYDVEMIDLLAVENTHGASGGNVMAIEDLRAYRKLGQERGVPMHLDGARIFNASVASGVAVTDYCAEVDTVMLCVSKGLGAPIGSLLCGPADLMPEARRIKILLGGAWRQAGIIAAAGLVALEEGPKRLHEDHERARRLAEGVAEILPRSIDPASAETNMVFVDTEPAEMSALEAVRRLAALGVGATISGGKVRMVTHVDISDEDVETALAAWRSVAAASR